MRGVAPIPPEFFIIINYPQNTHKNKKNKKIKTNHGIHGFLVRIRNPDMAPVAGVTIEDMGHKMGCNGVDNGKLWFDHVRVPRDALLDAFSSVAPDGAFASSIVRPRDRFLKVIVCLLVVGEV